MTIEWSGGTRGTVKAGGFIREPLAFKDYSHERVFGAGFLEAPRPLGRVEALKNLSLPIVFQGEVASCVSCTVTWIEQWLRTTGERLSWPFLSELARTGSEGATFSAVLEPARKIGICGWNVYGKPEAEWDAMRNKIPGYFRLSRFDWPSLFHASKVSPLLVGVAGYADGLDHAMALLDWTEDGKPICVNWWRNDAQDFVVLESTDRIVAAAEFALPPPAMRPKDFRFPFLEVLFSKFRHFFPTV